MWNQSEEHFVEIVSNDSLDHFPENTLTKFSNKLPYPLKLDGDWVVGVQEIFYPVDVRPSSFKLQVQLLSNNALSKKMITEIELEETDDTQMIIAKINRGLLDLYNDNTNNKRIKRSVDQSNENHESNIKENENTNTTESENSDKTQDQTQDKSFDTMWTPLDPNINTTTNEAEWDVKKLKGLSKEERRNVFKTLREKFQDKIDIQNLYVEMDKYEQQTIEQQQQIEKLQVSLKDFVTQVHELQEQMKQKISLAKYSEKNAENESIIRQKENTIQTLRGHIKHHEETIEAVRKDIRTERETNRNLQIQISKYEKDIRDYTEKHIKDAEERKNSILKLEEHKRQHEAVLAETEKEKLKKKYEADIENLNKQINELKVIQDENQKKFEIECNQSKDTISLKVEALNKCNDNITLLNTKFNSLIEQQEKDIKEMKEKITVLQNEKAQLENVNISKDGTLDQLKSENEELKGKKSELIFELSNKRKEIEQVINETERVRRSLEEEKSKVEYQGKILLQRLAELGIISKSESKNIEKPSDISSVPGLSYNDGKIIIFPGVDDGNVFVPYFPDPNFISALGFDAATYLQMLQSFNNGMKSFTGINNCNLNLRSHLMFIHSDIVAEHFVGNKSARVLRVVPLKRGDKSEIVHEKFLKPFYYPVRTNRIDDINFLLTDEMGNQIKFASGRVLIGLHLKRV